MFASVGSPLHADLFYQECYKADLPKHICHKAAGIMWAESRFCTDRHRIIEKDYWNCAGIKSQEILRTGKPDANGSWLKKFTSEQKFYEHFFALLRDSYIKKGYWTTQQIYCKWVKGLNKCNITRSSWIYGVQMIEQKLNGI
jgi:hypothetical protein